MKGCARMTTVRVIAGCLRDLSGLVWRKSSWSGGQECVEIAFQDSVLVRDSQNRCGGILEFPRTCWTQFLGATVNEQFPSGKYGGAVTP